MKSILFFLCLLGTTLTFAQTINIVETADQVNLSTSLNYQSHWSLEDINRAIDPANGGIQELFNDSIDLVPLSRTRYQVSSSVQVMPLVRMSFKSLLDYSQTRSGTKTNHQFRFYDFNHLFKVNTIKVEVSPAGNLSAVKISQVGVIKKDSYGKVKAVPSGPSKFRARILQNVQKFRASTGGN